MWQTTDGSISLIYPTRKAVVDPSLTNQLGKVIVSFNTTIDAMHVPYSIPHVDALLRLSPNSQSQSYLVHDAICLREPSPTCQCAQPDPNHKEILT